MDNNVNMLCLNDLLMLVSCAYEFFVVKGLFNGHDIHLAFLAIKIQSECSSIRDTDA